MELRSLCRIELFMYNHTAINTSLYQVELHPLCPIRRTVPLPGTSVEVMLKSSKRLGWIRWEHQYGTIIENCSAPR